MEAKMKKNRYIYFISFCLVAFCLFVFAYSKYTSQKEIQSNLILIKTAIAPTSKIPRRDTAEFQNKDFV